MRNKAVLWALGALLGIAITAAITWAASTITSQHIGLSSEPLSAGRQLAPHRGEGMPERGELTTTRTTSTTTATRREGAGPDD